MSKKVAVTFIAILAAFTFFIGSAFATAQTITGQVVSIEPSAKILVINAQGEEMAFRVAEEKAARLVRYMFTGFLEEQDMTFSEMEKTARALANLKPGDKVTVNYTEANGKLYAQSVTKD